MDRVNVDCGNEWKATIPDLPPVFGLSEDEREAALSAIKDIFQQTVPENGYVDEMV